MPRVLISYSHDAPSHSQKVLELADALRANGIDAIIDQYDPHPPQVWSMWMDQQIERADFVLMIFTERYYKRSRGEESPGIGHGVAWESVLIANELYESLHFNKKYIPVVFAGADKKWILPRMKGFTNYLLQEFTLENQNSFEMLYRHLTNQDATPAAPLGPRSLVQHPDFILLESNPFLVTQATAKRRVRNWNELQRIRR